MYMPPPPPKRRIMGMTIPQIAILAALAVGILLVFVIGGIILFSLSRSMAEETAAIIVPTPLLMPPTATPGPTATATPLPTPTPWPTVTPIPGWKQIVGQGVSLWLPEEYDGGNPASEMDALMQRYIAAGAEPNGAANDEQMMQENQAVLFAFARPEDTTVRFLHLVIATSKAVSAQTTVDSYLGNNLPSILGAEFRLVGREDIALNELPATRLSVERRFQSTTGESFYKEYALYFFKVGERMWRLEYSCDRNLFAQNLPIFDQSARSFAVSADANFADLPSMGPISTDAGIPANTEAAPVSPDGWVKLESSRVSILLPPEFEGGDMTTNADAVIARLEQNIPGFRESDLEETARDSEVFFITGDMESNSLEDADWCMGVIQKIPGLTDIPAGVSDREILDVLTEGMGVPPDASIREGEEYLTIHSYAAKRVALRYEDNLMGEIFVILDGETVWMIIYTYFEADYDQFHPICLQSASTFIIK